MIPFALNLQTFAIGLVIAALIGVGGSWYVQGLRLDAVKANHTAEIAQLELKVVKAEGNANKLRLDFQTNLTDKKNELDQTYATRVADLNGAVGKLASIRLRDPARNSDTGATSDQGNAEGDNRSASGELSLETSRFLWSFAGDADIVRERLQVCKAWNAELETQSQKYYDEIQELRKQLK